MDSQKFYYVKFQTTSTHQPVNSEIIHDLCNSEIQHAGMGATYWCHGNVSSINNASCDAKVPSESCHGNLSYDDLMSITGIQQVNHTL